MSVSTDAIRAHAEAVPGVKEYRAYAAEYGDGVSYDRLIDALAGNIVRRKSKTGDGYTFAWRKSKPDSGDARTWFTLARHERPGGEYLSIGELLMLRTEIGWEDYDRWNHTVEVLKKILQLKAKPNGAR